MQAAGIHHVAICVRDADAALAFYRDALGLRQLPRPDAFGPGHWLEAPDGTQLHLLELEAQPAPLQHFAIRVDDLDAAVADLAARGYDVQRAPLVPGAGHQAFLHDPSGNFVELNQPE